MSVAFLMAVLLAQAPAGAGSQPMDDRLPRLATSIEVRSDLGKRFRFVEARVVLDGLELTNRVAANGQELEHKFRAYDGAVTPGAHTVTVTLEYEGRNAGIFTYLDNYRFRVESTAEFTVHESSRPATILVLAYERPGVDVPLEKKPMMEIKAAPGSPVTAATKIPALSGR